ncbi:hypothetical protein [Pseudomonas typographi]|uniref:hypothetical protein n=1 Tax=Pseudomonas typographi TaxID=2715964 RepID=UPI001686D82D|nr:hypothetical protein [Pseudomonas typographi]MBD1554780.1 hypothetical protein [Pseudomonas typographi]
MSKYEITDQHGGRYSSDEPLPPLETLEEWMSENQKREPFRKELPDSLFNGTDTSEAAKQFGVEYQRIGGDSYEAHPVISYVIAEPDEIDDDGNVIQCMRADWVRDPKYDDQLSEDLYEAAKKLGLVE